MIRRNWVLIVGLLFILAGVALGTSTALKYSGLSYTSTGISQSDLRDPTKVPQMPTAIYCYNCNADLACSGGGSGAWAFWTAGAWNCATTASGISITGLSNPLTADIVTNGHGLDALNAVTLFAEKYPGANACAKYSSAALACPVAGSCVIDGKNLSTTVTCAASVNLYARSNTTWILPNKTITMASGLPFNSFTDPGAPKTTISLIGSGPSSAITCTNIPDHGCVGANAGATGYFGPYGMSGSPAVANSATFTVSNAPDIVTANVQVGDLLLLADRQAGPTDFGVDLRRSQYFHVTAVSSPNITVDGNFIYQLNTVNAGTWLKPGNLIDHLTFKNFTVTSTGGWSALWSSGVIYADYENLVVNSGNSFSVFRNIGAWRSVFLHNIYNVISSISVDVVETAGETESYDAYNTVSCVNSGRGLGNVTWEYGCNRDVVEGWQNTACNIPTVGNGMGAIATDDMVFNNNSVAGTQAAFAFRGSQGFKLTHNYVNRANGGALFMGPLTPVGGVWSIGKAVGAAGTCIAESTDTGDMFCTNATGGAPCTTGGVEPIWATPIGTCATGAFAYGQAGCTIVDNTCTWTYFGKYPIDKGNFVDDLKVRNSPNGVLLIGKGLGAAGFDAQNDQITNLDIDSVSGGLLLGSGQTLANLQTNGIILDHRDKTTNTNFWETTQSFLGQLNIRGSTSGVMQFAVPAAAGTPIVTGPTFSGTMPLTGTSVMGSIQACGLSTVGWTWRATDCNAACAAGTVCTGGGGTGCVLMCSGSVWRELGW